MIFPSFLHKLIFFPDTLDKLPTGGGNKELYTPLRLEVTEWKTWKSNICSVADSFHFDMDPDPRIRFVK